MLPGDLVIFPDGLPVGVCISRCRLYLIVRVRLEYNQVLDITCPTVARVAGIKSFSIDGSVVLKPTHPSQPRFERILMSMTTKRGGAGTSTSYSTERHGRDICCIYWNTFLMSQAWSVQRVTGIFQLSGLEYLSWYAEGQQIRTSRGNCVLSQKIIIASTAPVLFPGPLRHSMCRLDQPLLTHR